MRTALLKDLNQILQTPHHGTTLLNSPNTCTGATEGYQVQWEHKSSQFTSSDTNTFKFLTNIFKAMLKSFVVLFFKDQQKAVLGLTNKRYDWSFREKKLIFEHCIIKLNIYIDTIMSKWLFFNILIHLIKAGSWINCTRSPEVIDSSVGTLQLCREAQCLCFPAGTHLQTSHCILMFDIFAI